MEIKIPSFLLFIEPEGEATSPVIDTYTRKITGAFRIAKSGISGYSQQLAEFTVSDSGYRGSHVCGCGCASSSNKDYLMNTKEEVFIKVSSENTADSKEIRSVITNSLCIHYVACHRNSIPTEDLERILLLEGEEADPTDEELKFRPKDSFLKIETLRG